MVQIIPVEVSRSVFKNYIYIIGNPDTKSAVIIDPAFEKNKIEDILLKNNFKLHDVLITHTHMDHIHLVNDLAVRYNIPVWVSALEVLPPEFLSLNIRVFESDKILEFEDITIQTIHTPGHTKGSVCYLINNNLFTGDTMFIEGCGICPSKADAAAMFDSFQKIKSIVNSETRIFPGHCYYAVPGQPISYVMNNNFYYTLDNPEQFILFRMRKNKPPWSNFK